MVDSSKKYNRIAMLILAAGGSSRMQRSIKQLLPWKNSTLLGNAIKTGVNSNINNVFVVLGASYNQIMHQVKNKNVHFIYHKNWEEGMGSTISFGVNSILEKNGKIDAVLIALSDQPLIEVSYINNLINKFLSSDKNIISSNYGDDIGVPAIFDSIYFSDLIKLKADTGAKHLLAKFKEDIFVMDACKKLQDVDTFEKYTSLYEKTHL